MSDRRSGWRRWAVALLAIYALLGIVEILRASRDAGSEPAAAGFYPPERDETGRVFRWSRGAHGVLREPIAGAVVELALRAAGPVNGSGTVVQLHTDGRPLDRVLLRDGRWRRLSYFLPALLGEERWSRVEVSWTALPDGAAVAAIAGADPEWMERFFVLGPSPRRTALLAALWARATHRTTPGAPAGLPPPVRLELDSSTTWVPARHGAGDDDRLLGGAVGALAWSDEVPPEGIGFHPWECDELVGDFRWTRMRASLPLVVAGRRARVRLRAAHPDIAERPVRVRVSWNASVVADVVLRDGAWTTVALDPGWRLRDHGVLSLVVDRVWNFAIDARYARARLPDDRDLGVAMTRIDWR